MTVARALLLKLPAPRALLLVVFAASLAALLLGLAVSARPVAQGWLIGLVIWSSVAIGSLVLLLIHRLTGGHWGNELSGTLMRCAATLPLITLAFVPLAFGLSAPYRWAGRMTDLRPDLANLYLNQPAFLLRSFVALAGWTTLAVLITQGRCSRLTAALGLAFHGLIISLVAVDWILSIEINFGSSAFATGFAIQQILAALAFAAVVAGPSLSKLVTADLAALLLGTLLGTIYIDLMSFIVSWYGDLPNKAEWYLRRGENGWNWVILAAFIVGALMPVALLLSSKLRKSRTALRLTGMLVLLGVVLHVFWLMAPTFDAGSISAAFAAIIALTALSLAAADPILAAMRRWADDR